MNGISIENLPFAITLLALQLNGMTLFALGPLYAVRRRRQECISSPPQWGGGELHGSKNRKSFRSKTLQIYVNFGNRRHQTCKTVAVRHFERGEAGMPAATVWYGK